MADYERHQPPLAPTSGPFRAQQSNRRLWLMGALCLVGGVLALAYAVGMVR